VFPFDELWSWLTPELLAAVVAGLLKIIGIIIGALIARRVVSAVLARFFKSQRVTMLEERRSRTLYGLTQNVSRYAIDFVALLAILQALGIDTASLLAAAGIVGLAVGFGAQNLVKDIFGGFFIIFEDQLGVGEHVDIAGMEGLVEEVGLRTVKVRDFGGQLYTIPNHLIDTVTNYTRGKMRVLVRVDVAYEEDMTQAAEIMQQACDELARENPAIVEGPKVLGVDDLGASGVTFLLWARTEPMEQWGVGRALRQLVKQKLDAAGIEIPYPRQVLVPARATKVAAGAVKTDRETRQTQEG